MCSATTRASLALVLIFPFSSMAANDCTLLTVSTTDGFANVRSTPQVTKSNILGAVLDGMEIKPIRRQKHWIRIESPLDGWIHRTQTAHHNCPNIEGSDSSVKSLMTIAKRALGRDKSAVSALLRLSRAMDGSLSETYGEIIANLAGRDPQLLIDALSTEQTEVCRSALNLLQFGLGNGYSSERQSFELAIANLPLNHPVVTAWKHN